MMLMKNVYHCQCKLCVLFHSKICGLYCCLTCDYYVISMSQCGVDKAHLGHCMIDASSLVLGEKITSIYPLQSIGDEAAGQVLF